MMCRIGCDDSAYLKRKTQLTEKSNGFRPNIIKPISGKLCCHSVSPSGYPTTLDVQW
jgi:hypothetical protein